MDIRTLVFVFVLFLFISNANGKLGQLKLCVVGNPKLKATRTTKYCDLLGKSKRTPLTCIYAPDRLGCLLAISRRKADFSVFEAEDLYFSTLWDESSVLVVSEIRALKKKSFRYGIVAMVRGDSNITGIGDLRGKRLCHPGTENGPEWNYLFSQYFEERVAPADCDQNLSIYEDRIKTTSEFFGSACKAGPWSLDLKEDMRLKKKYRNLCELCDGGDCSLSDKYRGSGGSLVCFKDGVGDVLWARHDVVRAQFKFLESGGSEASSKFSFLCDDGSLMPLLSEEPCYWLAKPWQVVAANRKSATDVQKVVEMLSDEEQNDWEENLLHVIELYLEYIQNVLVSRTPEDYLRRIPGYLSASAMSQGNCKPMHSVNLCVDSSIAKEKCEWMSKAGSALGIQPSLQCVQKPNFTCCLESVARRETDVVSVAPDYFFEASTKYKLETFLLETGSHPNDAYLASVLVKKKSNIKILSDLKGKKICLTRRNGIGWWNLLLLLHEESLIESDCQGLTEYFGKVCVVSGEEEEKEEKLEICCSKDRFGDDEVDVLYCLEKNGCDAAVLDLNTLREISDQQNSLPWSKDLRLSDFRTVCGGNREKWAKDCHWLWSLPHYVMTSVTNPSPKSLEMFNVFYQLGQYFGKNSRKNNPMLQIFGPFHQVRNVLFRDTSTSFVTSSQWNLSNNFQETLDRMKICSKSSTSIVPSFFSLLSLVLYVFLIRSKVIF